MFNIYLYIKSNIVIVVFIKLSLLLLYLLVLLKCLVTVTITPNLLLLLKYFATGYRIKSTNFIQRLVTTTVVTNVTVSSIYLVTYLGPTSICTLYKNTNNRTLSTSIAVTNY